MSVFLNIFQLIFKVSLKYWNIYEVLGTLDSFDFLHCIEYWIP